MVATLDEAYSLPVSNYLAEASAPSQNTTQPTQKYERFENTTQCDDCSEIIMKLRECPSCLDQVKREFNLVKGPNYASYVEREVGLGGNGNNNFGRVREGFQSTNLTSNLDRNLAIERKPENIVSERKPEYSTFSFSNSAYTMVNQLVENFVDTGRSFINKSTEAPHEMFRLVVLALFVYLLFDFLNNKS
jgi:hypothetical protein